MIYVLGTCEIYATLIAMHRSNDVLHKHKDGILLDVANMEVV